MVAGMDFDLFDDLKPDRDRRRRHDRDDGDHRRSYRRAHPHRFAWVLLAGGAVVLGLLALGLLHATGLLAPLTDAYFTATTALMPTSWHDEWLAIPGLGHVVIAVVAAALLAGLAGEALELLD